MTSIKPNSKPFLSFAACAAVCLTLTACEKKPFNAADGAPQ